MTFTRDSLAPLLLLRRSEPNPSTLLGLNISNEMSEVEISFPFCQLLRVVSPLLAFVDVSSVFVHLPDLWSLDLLRSSAYALLNTCKRLNTLVNCVNTSLICNKKIEGRADITL